MKTWLALFAICTAKITSAADDWPQFRGPNGQGHAVDSDIPVTWSESENVTWKCELPGEGHSSPVIAGSQVWLTTAIVRSLTEQEEKRRLGKIKNPRGLKIAGALSLHAIQVNRETGRLDQQILLFEIPEPEPKHSLNSYASPTPVIEGDHLYCHFGTYGTACINRFSGEVVWKVTELNVDHQNGPGSSPVIWKDLVIIHFDGIDDQFITALDRATGKTRWRTKRSGKMDPKPEFQKAYGTPLVVDVDGRALVVSPAANWVYGYDAANGEEIWKASYGKLGFSTVPRPVIHNGTVYISTSYIQPRLVAVRIDGHGDVSETHVKWTIDKMAPKKPSMIVSGELLYTVTDNGIAACLDTTDGSEVWKARLSGDFSASPILANGRLYFFGQNGITTVLQEGRDLKELARNTLADGFMASPAVAGRALFVRTEKSLYRIEDK